jgi:hypothetical protein
MKKFPLQLSTYITPDDCNKIKKAILEVTNYLKEKDEEHTGNFDIETCPVLILSIQECEDFKLNEKIDLLEPIQFIGTMGNLNIFRRMYMFNNVIMVSSKNKKALIEVTMK